MNPSPTVTECCNVACPKQTVEQQGLSRLEHMTRELVRAQRVIDFARQFPDAAKFIESNDLYLT